MVSPILTWVRRGRVTNYDPSSFRFKIGVILRQSALAAWLASLFAPVPLFGALPTDNGASPGGRRLLETGYRLGDKGMELENRCTALRCRACLLPVWFYSVRRDRFRNVRPVTDKSFLECRRLVADTH